MSRRSLLGFVILNVIVTFVTVFGVFSVLQRVAPSATERPLSPPLIVVITATLDPRGTETRYIIVTATPNSGAAVPGQTEVAFNGTEAAGVGTGTTTGATLPPDIPTLDPSLLPNLGTAPAPGVGTAAATSSNGCQTYTIKQGDTAGNIATTFAIPLADLMRANKLKDNDLPRLQIGQVLVIPVNGCGLATEAPTATDTPTKFIVPTIPPTTTLAPTADKAQVSVAQVINPGDITSEGVEIHNVSGGVIQMQGWTLSDTKGLKFTFPDYRMFPGGRVTVYTKAGTNTPIVLYWGQSRSVWGDPSQQITISDAKGIVQATYALSGAGSPGTPDPALDSGSVSTPTS